MTDSRLFISEVNVPVDTDTLAAPGPDMPRPFQSFSLIERVCFFASCLLLHVREGDPTAAPENARAPPIGSCLETRVTRVAVSLGAAQPVPVSQVMDLVTAGLSAWQLGTRVPDSPQPTQIPQFFFAFHTVLSAIASTEHRTTHHKNVM